MADDALPDVLAPPLAAAGLDLVDLERTAHTVTVTVDRAMLAAADGEALPCAAPLPAGTPLRIRALPRALRVITGGPAGP